MDSPLTVGRFMRSTRLIAILFLAGYVIHLEIALALGPLFGGQANSYFDILLWVLAAYTVASIPLSFWLPRFLFLRNIPLQAPLAEKLAKWRAGFVLRYALVQGVAMFSLVTYSLLFDSLALVALAVCAVFHVATFPTKRAIGRALRLSPAEWALLHHDETTLDQPAVHQVHREAALT